MHHRLSPFNFNPRPLAGDDEAPCWYLAAIPYFNPRPLAGDDVSGQHKIALFLLFQSTSPCGGRLPPASISDMTSGISIHVPLRGTTVIRHFLVGYRQFQSTSPCGGRPVAFAMFFDLTPFQSTSPCGGRRDSIILFRLKRHFNPRPLAGDDLSYFRNTSHASQFQSTSPCGGRLYTIQMLLLQQHFNPRPLAGDDMTVMCEDRWNCLFQSTSPCGGRLDCTPP